MMKLDMGKTISLILVAVCLTSHSLFSKPIPLNLNLSLAVPGDCMFVTEGVELSFTWGAGCSADVIILKDTDPIPVYRTSKTSFDYTFEVPGEYVVFCGGGKTSAAISSVCFTVADTAVPTLGEWGIINLSLLLLIFSIVHITAIEPKTSFGQ